MSIAKLLIQNHMKRHGEITHKGLLSFEVSRFAFYLVLTDKFASIKCSYMLINMFLPVLGDGKQS